MQEISVNKPGGVNVEALDAQLRGALGVGVAGISVGDGVVRVHLADGLSAEQVEQARALVVAHDPAVLSPRQQAEVERKQQLEQARAAYAAPLNLAAYDSAEALLKTLAQKTSWLEQEIADLRSGA